LRRLIDVKEPKKKSQQEEEEDGVEGKNILELSALHCISVDDRDVHCNDDELGCCLRRSVPASKGKGEGKVDNFGNQLRICRASLDSAFF
jgi:hypothetical protein